MLINALDLILPQCYTSAHVLLHGEENKLDEIDTPEEVPADERVFVADWFPQSAFRMCFAPIGTSDRDNEPSESPKEAQTETKT